MKLFKRLIIVLVLVLALAVILPFTVLAMTNSEALAILDAELQAIRLIVQDGLGAVRLVAQDTFCAGGATALCP